MPAEFATANASTPLVRSCRTVIETAGQVTEVFRTHGTSPADFMAQLEAIDPRLPDAFASLADAVVELDYRTGYLGPEPHALPRAAL